MEQVSQDAQAVLHGKRVETTKLEQRSDSCCAELTTRDTDLCSANHAADQGWRQAEVELESPVAAKKVVSFNSQKVRAEIGDAERDPSNSPP